MNKSMRLVRIAIISVIGITSYIVCLKVFCYLMVISHYEFIIDPHFAPMVQASIRDTIHTAQDLNISHHKDILTRLQTTFPSIASSSLHLYAPRTARITITCHTPSLIVNEATAVTAQGHAFPSEQLETHYQATCARMAVLKYDSHDREYNALLAMWIQKLPQDIRADHTISWIDEIAVYLTSLRDPHFKCVCSSEHPPTTSLIATSYQLKESIMQSARNRNHIWIADIRFSHQIILYTEKSGGAYG